MTAIELPTHPKDKEFEEKVAAIFQAANYYVQRNVIERAQREILELDLVVTKYNYDNPVETFLVEIKSAGWGFSDIFKIYGWMNYLRIQNGALFVDKYQDKDEFCVSKSSEMNIKIVDANKCDAVLSDVNARFFFEGRGFNAEDVDVWRYSNWIERVVVNRLMNLKKSSGNECYKMCSDFLSKINNDTFFERNVVKNVEGIYKLHKENSNVSSRCSALLKGNSWDGKSQIDEKDFKDYYYKAESNYLLVSTYVEQRSRLLLLKNVVDYILYDKFNDARAKSSCEIYGHTFDWFDLLPTPFRNAVDILAKHEYVHLYPTFWNWFIFIFGGFILKNSIEREYKLLSEKTKIPVDKIDEALSVYDILFPKKEKSWFLDDSPYQGIKILKFSLLPHMGIGASYRNEIYGDGDPYGWADKTIKRDLIKWHRACYDLLNKN